MKLLLLLPVIRGVELVGVQDGVLDMVLLDGVQDISRFLVDWVALVPANRAIFVV